MKADGYKPTTKKIDMSQLFQILTVKSPEKYANKTLYEVLHDRNTWQEGVVNHLQREVERGEHLAFCLPRNVNMNSMKPQEMTYPKFEALKPEPKSCSKNQELAGSLMHRAVLDTEGKYVMLWTPGEEDITFEIQ
ncbi:hypothetical protein C7M84_013854, partial [Penaeus vannamei]